MRNWSSCPGTRALMWVNTRSSHLNIATSRYAAARSTRTCHSSGLTLFLRLAISSVGGFIVCLLEVIHNRSVQRHDAVTSATRHEYPRSYTGRTLQHRLRHLVLEALCAPARRHPGALIGAAAAG